MGLGPRSTSIPRGMESSKKGSQMTATLIDGSVGYWPDQSTAMIEGFSMSTIERMLRKAEPVETEPVTNEQVANVLDRVRRVLRKQGWAQGVMLTHDGERCLLGALQFAISGSDTGSLRSHQRLYEACIERLAGACMGANMLPIADTRGTWYRIEYLATLGRAIFRWNDARGRTWRQVNRLLKNEIKALRA